MEPPKPIYRTQRKKQRDVPYVYNWTENSNQSLSKETQRKSSTTSEKTKSKDSQSIPASIVKPAQKLMPSSCGALHHDPEDYLNELFKDVMNG